MKNVQIEILTAVFEKNRNNFVNYVKSKFLFDSETAKDIISESYVKAFEQIQTYDSSKGTVYAWLCTIITNASIDYLRKNGRQRTFTSLSDKISDEELSGDEILSILPVKNKEIYEVDIQKSVASKEIYEFIMKNIDKINMTSIERKVFIMTFEEDASIEDIQKKLDISSEYVRKAKSFSRQKVLLFLKKHLPDVYNEYLKILNRKKSDKNK